MKSGPVLILLVALTLLWLTATGRLDEVLKNFARVGKETDDTMNHTGGSAGSTPVQLSDVLGSPSAASSYVKSGGLPSSSQYAAAGLSIGRALKSLIGGGSSSGTNGVDGGTPTNPRIGGVDGFGAQFVDGGSVFV